MEMQTIFNIIYCVLIMIAGGFSLWFSSNSVINKHVTSFIKEAESIYKDQTKAGGVKFQWVVTKLYNLIPAVIKPFIPVSVVEELVQKTFDAIESYAKMQLDKAVDNISNK